MSFRGNEASIILYCKISQVYYIEKKRRKENPYLYNQFSSNIACIRHFISPVSWYCWYIFKKNIYDNGAGHFQFVQFGLCHWTQIRSQLPYAHLTSGTQRTHLWLPNQKLPPTKFADKDNSLALTWKIRRVFYQNRKFP